MSQTNSGKTGQRGDHRLMVFLALMHQETATAQFLGLEQVSNDVPSPNHTKDGPER